MKSQCLLHLSLCFMLIASSSVEGQGKYLLAEQVVGGDTAVFRFASGDKVFRATYKGNEKAIAHLSRSIRAYYDEIQSGEVKIRVKGFWDAGASHSANLLSAKEHSNNIKSYFIVTDSVKEAHFRTTNYVKKWRGQPDVVAIAYLFRESGERVMTPPEPEPELIVEPIPEPATEPEVTLQPELESLSATAVGPGPVQSVVSEPQTTRSEAVKSVKPDASRYRWAVKTNVAYLAVTVANFGVEYSFGKHYSVDLSIIYSPYTVARDYRLRFLAVQPEFRYWLGTPMQGHFFGAHLNVGAFNISVEKEKRYQSPNGFYGVGLSYGYVLPFARHWGAEFTVGAGYVHTKYDVYYNIPNGARYEKGIPYNYWGLTKIGINLVYRFGK